MEDKYVFMDTVVAKTVGYLMKDANDVGGIYLTQVDITDENHLYLIYVGAMSAALAEKPFGIDLSLIDYIKFKLKFKKRINFKRRINCVKINCNVVLDEILKDVEPIDFIKPTEIFSTIYKEYYDFKAVH